MYSGTSSRTFKSVANSSFGTIHRPQPCRTMPVASDVWYEGGSFDKGSRGAKLRDNQLPTKRKKAESFPLELNGVLALPERKGDPCNCTKANKNALQHSSSPCIGGLYRSSTSRRRVSSSGCAFSAAVRHSVTLSSDPLGYAGSRLHARWNGNALQRAVTTLGNLRQSLGRKEKDRGAWRKGEKVV